MVSRWLQCLASIAAPGSSRSADVAVLGVHPGGHRSGVLFSKIPLVFPSGKEHGPKPGTPVNVAPFQSTA
jgi:hypothetical protein